MAIFGILILKIQHISDMHENENNIQTKKIDEKRNIKEENI